MRTITKIGIYERRDGHAWLLAWLTRGNWLRMTGLALSLRAFPRAVRFPAECAEWLG